MRNGPLKVHLWGNAGIRIAVYPIIRMIPGVVNRKLKMEVRRCGC